jgi:hypothetical protein
LFPVVDIDTFVEKYKIEQKRILMCKFKDFVGHDFSLIMDEHMMGLLSPFYSHKISQGTVNYQLFNP